MADLQDQEPDRMSASAAEELHSHRPYRKRLAANKPYQGRVIFGGPDDLPDLHPLRLSLASSAQRRCHAEEVPAWPKPGRPSPAQCSYQTTAVVEPGTGTKREAGRPHGRTAFKLDRSLDPKSLAPLPVPIERRDPQSYLPLVTPFQSWLTTRC